MKNTETPGGYTPAEWGEFLDGLRAALVAEADSKWTVGDYLVRRIHGSATTAVVADGVNNGAGLVIRQAARDVAYQVSEKVLHDRYMTAAKFPEDARVYDVAWTVYRDFAKRGDSQSAMAAFMSGRETTTVPEVAEHLGQPIVRGHEAVALSLNNGKDKVAEVVADLTPEVKDKLVRELAKDDAAAVYRVADEVVHEQTEPGRRKHSAPPSERKAYEAWCATKAPLNSLALISFALTTVPAIESMVDRVKERGIDDEAAHHLLAYVDRVEGLLRVLRAQVTGDLDPIPQAEFDAAIDALLGAGGAK